MTTELKKFWLAVAEYYGVSITQSRLEMYCADTKNYQVSGLYQAFQAYRTRSQDRRLPMPSDLTKIMVGDDQNTRDASVEVAARIIAAISRFGAYGCYEASDFIGEVGQKVVQLQGGWSAVCELKTDEINTRQAQWRELARSMLDKSKVAPINDAPRFPRGNYHVGSFLKTAVDPKAIGKNK